MSVFMSSFEYSVLKISVVLLHIALIQYDRSHTQTRNEYHSRDECTHYQLNDPTSPKNNPTLLSHAMRWVDTADESASASAPASASRSRWSAPIDASGHWPAEFHMSIKNQF